MMIDLPTISIFIWSIILIIVTILAILLLVKDYKKPKLEDYLLLRGYVSIIFCSFILFHFLKELFKRL